MAEKDKKKTKSTKEVKEEEVIEIDTSDDEVEVEVEKKKVSQEEEPEEDLGSGPDEVKDEEDKEKSPEPTDYFAKSTVYADDSSSATVEKSFSFKRLLFFLAVIAISAAIFFAGLSFFNFQFSSVGLSNPLSEPTPTVTPTPEATPTPEPELMLSEYSVQVLNGSGVTGAAADVAELLETEGFENVDVGNASDQDYEDTEVQLAEGVSSEVFSIISSALSNYNVVEGAELDEDAEFDIVVTVGQTKESADEDEPTPTETEESEE